MNRRKLQFTWTTTIDDQTCPLVDRASLIRTLQFVAPSIIKIHYSVALRRIYTFSVLSALWFWFCLIDLLCNSRTNFQMLYSKTCYNFFNLVIWIKNVHIYRTRSQLEQICKVEHFGPPSRMFHFAHLYRSLMSRCAHLYRQSWQNGKIVCVMHPWF